MRNYTKLATLAAILSAAITGMDTKANAQTPATNQAKPQVVSTNLTQTPPKGAQITAKTAKTQKPKLSEEQRKALNEKVQKAFQTQKEAVYSKVKGEYEQKANQLKAAGKLQTEEQKLVLKKEFNKARAAAGRQLKKDIRKQLLTQLHPEVAAAMNAAKPKTPAATTSQKKTKNQ
jgi:hypothetical protein